MIRAAIYARFSDEKQNDRSVDDQVDFCREICSREKFTVALVFDDREISGASTVNRPGFNAMMRAADAGQFDIIVAEEMDRLFRNQADYHAARNRLDFLGVGIHLAGGKVGRLDGALRAMVGEIFLSDLAVHVRRGLEGVVRSGRHAGGRAYGYALVPGKPGELVVDDAQAAIVRRIFAEFTQGRTPRAIAAALNVDLVPPPRGRRWNASTINGNSARGHGMLLNALYIGRIVWNKVRMIKDPATGRRVSRVNAAAAHRFAEATHLRIVDDAIWSQAQAIKTQRSHLGAARSRKPPRPLSGLLKCGCCGGGMVSIGATRRTPRLQCSTHKESGACGNGRKVSRAAIEQAVFAGLAEELAQPAAITEYIKTYNAERRRLAKGAGAEQARLARKLSEMDREMDRLIDAVAKGSELKALVPRINALERQRDEARAQLARCESTVEPIALHPAAIEQYLADVGRLSDLVAAHADLAESAELVATLRRLVTEVIVHAAPGSPALAIEVRGRLAELTGSAAFPNRSKGGVNSGSGRLNHPMPPAPPGLLFTFRRDARAA